MPFIQIRFLDKYIPPNAESVCIGNLDKKEIKEKKERKKEKKVLLVLIDAHMQMTDGECINIIELLGSFAIFFRRWIPDRTCY